MPQPKSNETSRDTEMPSAAPGADHAAVAEVSGAGSRELPIMPAVAARETPAEETAADAEQLGRLLRFCAHGMRAEEAPSGAEDCWPALLFPYRELTSLRHDYPLCVADGEGGLRVRALTEVIDAALTELGEGGDAGGRLAHHAHQLEAAIKIALDARPEAPFDELCERAGQALVSGSGLASEKKQRLQQDVERVLGKISDWDRLLGCGETVPRALLAAAWGEYWGRHCAAWRDELDGLMTGLRDILRAGFDRSPEARKSEHLRDSLGDASQGDVDSERMSDILAHARLGGPLPAARRERIEEGLGRLELLWPVFDPTATHAGTAARAPFSLDPIVDDCAAAVAEQRRRMDVMVAFFRAVRIARLEVDNRYREGRHDAFFADFDASHLTAGELALCPPVILIVGQSHLASGQIDALLQLLASGQPYKILVRLDDLASGGSGEGGICPAWPGRIASLAMALNHVHVLQCSLARPRLLLEGIEAGLGYAGAALFSVYAGAGAGHSRLPAYLDAAAAMDSRAFPAFCFDPSRGGDLAARMRLLENPAEEQPWPSEALPYRTVEGSEESAELAFSLADYLFTDRRLADQFWPLAASAWHAEMMPVDEFLACGADVADTKVPYITAVDAEGEIVRVVVTRTIVEAAAQAAAQWRSLQEAGGIRNSHALALLAREQARLAAEQEEAIAAMQAQFDARLDQSIGELTEEIVARIAAQLTGAAVELAPMPGARPAPAAKGGPPSQAEAEAEAVAEAATEAVEEAEEEEETLSLDEPYIDTVLCTSCDDCTKMSPHIFAYDENKQAYIKDVTAGSYQELVLAAEKCPVNIIHPGKPKDPNEADLEQWMKRAEPFM